MPENQEKKDMFYIVDVFAEEKYEGNQLAVVICSKNFDEKKMQKIAREMNFSETIFITSLETYDVKIFTPKMELPFAGHPLLGAAYIINHEFIKDNVKTLTINTSLGPFGILFKYKGNKIKTIWMSQEEPSFYGFISHDTMAEILNLEEADFDKRFTIQEISTGLPFIIVPLKNLDALKRAFVNLEKYYDLIVKKSAKSILIFCPETRDKNNDLSVRVFSHALGVPEDPATGSGNGCLAAYLSKNEYFGKTNIDIKVEQGYELGRKSLIYLRCEKIEDKYNILIGGSVQLIVRGELL